MNRAKSTLVETLTLLSRRLRHLLSEIYTDRLGLSDSAVSLLKVLSQEGTEESRRLTSTQSQLARELSLSESSLCTLVERLRLKELLERERLVEDRRKTRLRLTGEGIRMVAEIKEAEHEFEEAFWKQLTGSKKIAVNAVLEDVIAACHKCLISNNTERRAA